MRAEDFMAIIEGGKDEEGDLDPEKYIAPSSLSMTVKEAVAKDQGVIIFFPGRNYLDFCTFPVYCYKK